MKVSNAVVQLSGLIVVLALVAVGVGFLYQDGGNTFSFTSVRGETVQMYGHGLYRYDSQLVGTGYRVQDAATLVLGVPLLVLGALLYRRGSPRGAALLSGVLTYFLYNYASMAFGAAYNNMFLVYLAIFSASLFALVVALASFDVRALPAHFANGLPRRGISVFLIVSGVVLLAVWLFLSILPGLLSGAAPELDGYTTGITWAVDMGIVGPTLIIAGVLLARRAPIGYLLASTMLVFSVVLGIQLAAMGIAQFSAGLFGIGQFIGMVGLFAILTLFAIWFTIALFRNVSESALPQAGKLGLARA
jgi:hypothetical protein